MKPPHGILAVSGLLAVVACGQDRQETASEVSEEAGLTPVARTLSVYVVNYPLAYFAELLGGDRVSVSFPAPRDVDPAYWTPEPDVIGAYQQSDLILLNGVDYAKWLSRASLPAGRLVNTSAAFEDRWVPLEQGPIHTHGPEGEHSHKGYAFTTWLDPRLAVAQAEAIAGALAQALPDQESGIREAFEALRAEWEQLDAELESIAGEIGDQPLVFSHPVYQYFEARYELNGVSVNWEPDRTPTEEQWRELDSILEGHRARWMIWESQPLPEVEQRLAELGIESVVFDPSSNLPETGDLLSVMRGNVAEFRQISAVE